MRSLALCSYICAGLAILGMGLLLVQPRMVQHLDFILVVAFIPPALQIVYTRMTSAMLLFDEFLPTDLLDDFELNHLNGSDEVVSTGFWLKGIATINSFILCIAVLSVISSIQILLLIMIDAGTSNTMRYATLAILGATVFAFPAVIYNLRTYNLKRIRRNSPV